MGLENASSRWFADTDRPVALRGEHLALVQTSVPDGDIVVLCELDGDGGPIESVTYDADDKAGALAELTRRHLALPSTPPIVHAVQGWTDAFNTRNWDGFHKVLAEDLLVVDHRPIAIGNRNDRSELMGSVKAGVDLVPDMFVYVVQDYALAEHAACGLLRIEGHTVDGGPIEWVYVAVTAMRPDGQIHLFEEFDVEDTADAMARFRELA